MSNDNIKEVWKAIPDFPKYEVSNFGRIRSYQKNKNGYVLKQATHKTGYKQTALYKRGQRYLFYTHRLVMLAFVGEYPDGMEVNHIDGIRVNNQLANLEYCTPSQNLIHAYNVLKRPTVKGKQHGLSKLDKDKVKKLRQLLSEGELSQRKIAKLFEISQSTVSEIKRGLIWAWIDNE